MPVTQDMQVNSYSFGPFVWFVGVVEDINDPEEAGRVRVRIFGYHDDTLEIEELAWAIVAGPPGASFSGMGTSVQLLKGTHVIGFFMDAHNAQNPIITNTIISKCSPIKGAPFGDPDSEYPTYPAGESDINRLARGRTNNTPVEWRRESVDTAPRAFGGTFKEKETAYAAEYPHNHVYYSEAPEKYGHLQEFDDTPGSERVLLSHKIGNFIEMHPEGDQVEKTVKDRYIIIGKDDHLHVLGDGMVTIDGDAYILFQKNTNIEVKGSLNLKVDGGINIQGQGQINLTSGTGIKQTAPRVDLN